MKKSLLSLALLAALPAWAADPSLSIYVFDGNLPAAGVEVRSQARSLGLTSQDGALRATTAEGEQTLLLLRGTEELARFVLKFVADENAQLIVTLNPDGPPSLQLESSHQSGGAASAETETAAPGWLRGVLRSSEDGKPVVGARIFVSGTPIDVQSDAEGRFEVQVASGSYSISVIAAEYATQTLDGVEVPADGEAIREIELTPAGLELPEFVVLEPFVEGSLASFVEERRSSSAVTDVLGAEAISRAGDSDAAGALKRVTGLTLVDGKFVYVRGLGERYSSALLNGAQIPSPDPTRRVVPLDLFPTEILEGIVVQKTYSPDMPGEFGGGTIQLRTRGVPEAGFLKLSGSLAYADGTSGDPGFRTRGGSRDWLGRDDGTRAMPDGLSPQLPADPLEREALGEALAGAGYDITTETLAPNDGLTLSGGQRWQIRDDWNLGFVSALRYSQGWDSNEEIRRAYSLESDGDLLLRSEFLRQSTERNVETGAFLNFGLEMGEHHRIDATTLLVRQSSDEAQIDDGYLEDPSDRSRFYEIEWIENELFAQQFQGEHVLPALAGLKLDWQYTKSRAKRESPNQRNYRYDRRSSTGEYLFSGRPDSNTQRFARLDDDNQEYRVDLSLPLEFGEHWDLDLGAGGSLLDKQRDSWIERYQFRGLPRTGGTPGEIINPDTIGPDGATLQNNTRATDTYFAEQGLDAWYLNAEIAFQERYRLSLGARLEDNLQKVVTFEPFNPDADPVVAAIDSSDLLPAAAFTWVLSDKQQLRFGWGETISRPDFRELTEAEFTDPLLDTTTIGNPELRQGAITHYDARWEYYFDDVDSVSVALFAKDFSDPIEKVRVPGTGTLLSFTNAKEALNYGIEFDVYKGLGFVEDSRVDRWPVLGRLPWDKLFVGLNYSFIESEIDLGDTDTVQTTNKRPLQGQSPYVFNLQLGYSNPEREREATLLYNVSGERISEVGVQGQPDTYEQPFDQLDFVYSQGLWEGWKLKLRLKNLLDPDVEFTQGNQLRRGYSKGREFGISLEWKPGS